MHVLTRSPGAPGLSMPSENGPRAELVGGGVLVTRVQQNAPGLRTGHWTTIFTDAPLYVRLDSASRLSTWLYWDTVDDATPFPLHARPFWPILS